MKPTTTRGETSNTTQPEPLSSVESAHFDLEEQPASSEPDPFSQEPINPFSTTPDLRFEGSGFQLIEGIGLSSDAVHFAACDIMLPLGMPFKLLLVSGHDEEGSPYLRLMLHRPSAERLADALENGRILEIINPLYKGQS